MTVRSQPPLGAVLECWLRPAANQVHIHRIEVEHALYLAASTQEQIKEVLAETLRIQSGELRHISVAIDELRDELAAGFSVIAGGIDRLDSTIRTGIYQLHLDALGTNSRLDDLLLLLYDREAYHRELARRRAAQEARDRHLKASLDYSGAMLLTKRALNESNRAKASAMLDEAITLFDRASTDTLLAQDAHFQLGYLLQQHRADLECAYQHYEKALGDRYSAHYVRTSRHLAHLDYRARRYTKALERLTGIIDHDKAIIAFAADLRAVARLPWDDNACIIGLEKALSSNVQLLERCARLRSVRAQFADQRQFSATEGFLESYSAIDEELTTIRPELRTYYDAARYAVKSHRNALALPWLKHCVDIQPTLDARRAVLIEAMADEDLRNG